LSAEGDVESRRFAGALGPNDTECLNFKIVDRNDLLQTIHLLRETVPVNHFERGALQEQVTQSAAQL